ncbi:hypothetical protein [Paraburkholderia sp. GAS42]|uniref:hypothetical protein n=1 Tax=Paraburkholderia sp. GAS42 TaxID=3035135 RepID=UPI003D2029B7
MFKNKSPIDGEAISTSSLFRDTFVSSFVAFMSDCGFTAEATMAPSNVILALQATYRPERDFWRQLDALTVLDTLSNYASRFQQAIEAEQHSSLRTLADELAGFIAMNAFDEANAERLSALPPDARPHDAESAYEWICAHPDILGNEEHLRYAQRDGSRCGEAALALLEAVEAAAAGLSWATLGSEVAEMVRAAAIRHRQANERVSKPERDTACV